jgi:tubulin-specific chaperone B
MSSSYRTPSNMQAVRTFVLEESSGQAQAADTVLLRVSHSNLAAVFPELRLSRSMLVGDVKAKLYAHVGSRPAFMRVFLVRGGGNPGPGAMGTPLSDDSRPLGFYSPAPRGDALHIVDDDPFSASKGGWLEDTSLVEKYVISDDEYAKRPDSYVKYRERMREADPNWTMNRALAETRARKAGQELPPLPHEFADDDPDNPPGAKVGDRVEVTPGGKRGDVMFVGRELRELPKGWWLGVCYDEPVGKNDGEVKGVRYFTAPPSHGALVRPSNATVGDFPPIDDFADNDDEDEI